MTDRVLRVPGKADMDRNGSSWPVLLSAVLLSGAVAAVVAAATVRLAAPEAPGIVSVRLGELTAAWTTRAAAQGRTAKDVRIWGAALEAALERVAQHHGVVLLPARAVAAGAPDMTPHVEAALERFLARGAAASSRSIAGNAP